jgi:Flp pilus assembly protein TadG
MVIRKLKNSAASFRRDEDGVVAMTFALAVTGVAMMIGCAVDIGKALHAHQKMSQAVDGATVAAAKALKDGVSVAQVQTMARTFFDTNMKGSGDYATVSTFNVDVNQGAKSVTITLESAMPTTFARVAGVQKINLPQQATAVFAVRDIEVGLALDVTGSMSSAPARGGARKIDTLKSAVETFANLMLPDTPVYGQKVRIGLAPYSAAINLGSYASAAANNRSSDGCVTERTNSARYSDESPASGGYFKVAADNARDIDPTEGNVGSVAYTCPKAVLQPLTDRKADIITAVKSYKEGGWTAGHFGAQWAWNLVSEDWGSVFTGSARPDKYQRVRDQELTKAVILMTDGVFNTAFNNAETSAKQALELCKNMKDKGVVVFSIAFDAPAAAKKTLEDCATPGPDYFADASDADDLNAAFASFAAKIKALRLTQ